MATLRRILREDKTLLNLADLAAKQQSLARSELNRDLPELGALSAALEISDTQCGHDFSFELHGNHLRPFPQAVQVNGLPVPWYEALTEREQQLVFQEALAGYRQRSRGNGGWQLAALGVTENGDIFVSENTESLSSDFYRQCAEQNMVTIATQREAYHEYTEHLLDDRENVQMQQAKLPKFRSFTLMGGNKVGQATCPCGNCTELLSKVMMDGAPMYIAPVTKPRELEQAEEMPLPRLDARASSLREVTGAATRKTTMETLNAERKLPLKQPEISRDAYTAMCERIAQRMSTELSIDYEGFGEGNFMASVGAEVLKRPPSMPITVSSQPFPEVEVNMFLNDKIERAVTNRVRDLLRRSDPRPHSVSAQDVQSLIEEHIEQVRCVALQTQSGHFHHAVSAISTLDRALPCAEIMALGGTTEDSIEDGIRNMRGAEFNPKHIAEGIMETSPKDGVERVGKRRGSNGGTLNFGYYPFNGGALDVHGLRHVTETRSLEQLFPGYFTGRAPSHGERVSAEVPPSGSMGK